MRKINIAILFANLLTGLASLMHAFVGDTELIWIEPAASEINWAEKQQIWTMVRCGWHWISFDLLFASISLGVVNFTNYFGHRKTFFQIMSFYFLGYAVVWICVILVSRSFPNHFLQLGQWLLLLVISGFIYYGASRENA